MSSSMSTAMRWLHPWARISFITGGTFVALSLIHEHVCTFLIIEGGSMRPALNPDPQSTSTDMTLLWKWNYTPKHGDVICFWPPQSQRGAAVKRVIGLAGDWIIPRPVWLSHQPKLKVSRSTTMTNDKEQIQARNSTNLSSLFLRHGIIVPKDHIWVEGDNAENSSDSNMYGPVSIERIQGHVSHILFPQQPFPVTTHLSSYDQCLRIDLDDTINSKNVDQISIDKRWTLSDQQGRQDEMNLIIHDTAKSKPSFDQRSHIYFQKLESQLLQPQERIIYFPRTKSL